ncbi:MAG: CsbD family protein [bacterium]
MEYQRDITVPVNKKKSELIAAKDPAVKSKSGRRNTMKSSTKDQAKGTFHELKGKAKEIAGKITDNPKLEAEGTGEKIAGKAQEKIGQVKKVFGK